MKKQTHFQFYEEAYLEKTRIAAVNAAETPNPADERTSNPGDRTVTRMNNQTHFRPYEPDQPLIFPRDMKDWLPEDDLVYFLIDVVNELDLSAFYNAYNGAKGGQPPYNPRMMATLLLYAYCVGLPSSRKIEQATYHSIPFRVLTSNQHPDHDTIADFRRRHLNALSDLFVQVLTLCREAGLVKLGHVALDGTKVRANASKHKAMSYGRMEKKVVELEEEVKRLLREAETKDAEDDALYGKGGHGVELPDELRFKQSRLKKIRESMQVLEADARARAEKRREEIREKEEAREKEGKKSRGRKPKEPSDKPEPKAQRNFTDPDSRIMKDGATKSFEQSYNCQAAVDAEAQIIVAADVTQETNDKKQVKPLVEKLKENIGVEKTDREKTGHDEEETGKDTGAEKPEKLSADTGYFSEANVAYLEDEGIDAYVATGRTKHGSKPPPPRGRIPRSATVKERMDRKLRTVKGRSTYSKRKEIVEPVFGQIKEARGFRRFLLRGFEKVKSEWSLICLTHNLLKLFRSGFALGGG